MKPPAVNGMTHGAASPFVPSNAIAVPLNAPNAVINCSSIAFFFEQPDLIKMAKSPVNKEMSENHQESSSHTNAMAFKWSLN